LIRDIEGTQGNNPENEIELKEKIKEGRRKTAEIEVNTTDKAKLLKKKN
jgi:hypothetical protein